MPIVKMGFLLRNPNAVFDDLTKSGDPVLITRNGDPLAMLTRVEPAEAMSAVMSVLPEFEKRRESAEFARGEGRVGSADEILARTPADETATDDQFPVTLAAGLPDSLDRTELVGVVADAAAVEPKTVEAVLRALQATFGVVAAKDATVRIPGRVFPADVETRGWQP